MTPEKSDLEVTSDDEDDVNIGTKNELSKSYVGRKDKTLETASLAIDVNELPPPRKLPFGTIGKKKVEERSEAIFDEASGRGVREECVVEREPSVDGDETSDDEL